MKKKFLIFRANKAFFRHILKNGKKLIVMQLIIIILSSPVSYVTVMAPKMFLDSVSVDKDIVQGILWIVAMTALIILVNLVSNFVSIYKKTIYSEARLEAKKTFARKMSRLCLSFFDKPEKMNEMNQAASYNENGGAYAIDAVVALVSSMVSLVTLSFVSLQFDWWVWIAIIALFVYKLVTVPIIRNENFRFNKEKVIRDRKISYFSNVLLGVKYLPDMRIFNCYDFFETKYADSFLEDLKLTQKFETKMAAKNMLLSMPSKIFDIFLYLVIGIKLLNQEATVGDYTLFFHYGCLN